MADAETTATDGYHDGHLAQPSFEQWDQFIARLSEAPLWDDKRSE